MTTLYDAARDHRATTGKYQVVTLKRGYAIRNIIDGYIEAKCKTREQADMICSQLNGNP